MKSPSMRAPTASAAALRTHTRRAGGSAGASGGSAAASCCMLGRLQYFDDAERARAAGERLGAVADAVDEVLGGEGERLGGGRQLEAARREVADRDDGRGARVAAPVRAVDGVVVEREAALLEAALVGQHALAPDDRHGGGLLGVEPAQVEVRRDTALELGRPPPCRRCPAGGSCARAGGPPALGAAPGRG